MTVGILIDASIPRTQSTRVSKLLDAVSSQLHTAYNTGGWGTFPADSYKKYYELCGEYAHGMASKEEDIEFWSDLEDEVIDLINILLPPDKMCMLHPDYPGDVIIMEVLNV